MANLKREVDEMRSDMVKSDSLELWSKDMEVAITPVLTILDEHMRNLDIRGGVTNNIENSIPYPEIIALENKWEGN